MKKFVYLIAFCFCCWNAQPKAGQLQESITQSDTLHWTRDRKLVWADFNGPPDTTSPGSAATVSGFETHSRYINDSNVEVVIIAVFYKRKSWRKINDMNADALNHEQGHFNITEVFARKASNFFKAHTFGKNTINKEINQIFDSFVVAENRIQELYDQETDHRRNIIKQRQWDKKIEAWLRIIPND